MLSLGRRESEPKLVDLRVILASVRDLVAPSMADPLHRIAFEAPEEPVLVHADATEVMQVALNLALNARDALVPGREGIIALTIAPVGAVGPEGKLVVGEMPEEAALIRVRDTGCGIASNDFAQVFEPFYTRKGEAGTGLGLAVVRGSLQVQAARSRSRARRAKALCSKSSGRPSREPRNPRRSPPPARSTGTCSPARPCWWSTTTRPWSTPSSPCSNGGAEPAPCLDPDGAIAAIEEDPQAFDLVVTDYDMPGMNGPDLARALRAIRDDLPLLLLTAVPLAYGRRAGEAEPFDVVLGKPAPMDSLVASARLAIANARRRTP
jgi:CheY-like chemotaxis protein